MTSITVGVLSSEWISVTLRHVFRSWMRYLQQPILSYLRNLNGGITMCLDTYFDVNSVRQHSGFYYIR